MTEFFAKRTSLGFSVYKLVIYKTTAGAIKSALTNYVAATAAVRWADMHVDEKVLVGVSALLGVLTYLDGFFDKSLSEVEKKRDEAEFKPPQ